jgi:hypothetical protein
MYLKFKFLKNRAISLGGDDNTYQVRFEMREELTAQNMLREAGGGNQHGSVVRPFFLLDEEFEVPLLDETPMTPVRPKGMASKVYDFLVDSAMKTAVDNKRLNDIVRERILAYVTSGTIQVTEDPFAIETEPFIEPE